MYMLAIITYSICDLSCIMVNGMQQCCDSILFYASRYALHWLFLISVSCIVLMSTTDVIVNLTSTAMGSNATYQCRDNPSDVYTTQCASDGVWEPDLNTLDCRFREPGIYMYNTLPFKCTFIINMHVY